MLYILTINRTLVVKTALLASLREGPFVVYVKMIQFVMQEQLNCLLYVDHSLNQEADISLLLHLLTTSVHFALELEAGPFLSRFVEESDDAVNKVNRKAKDVEIIRLKL